MLEERLAQAKMSDEIKQSFMDAYGYSEADYIQLDQNVVSDDIMHAINSRLFNVTYPKEPGYFEDDGMGVEFDEFGDRNTSRQYARWFIDFGWC